MYGKAAPKTLPAHYHSTSDLPTGWGKGKIPLSEELESPEGADHVGYDGAPVGIPATTVGGALNFLAVAGPGGGLLSTNITPIGPIDGINATFTTPTTFLHNGLNNEMLYLRGLRIREGVGNDYVAAESGGPGTGYDTLILASPPLPGDVLLIDYYPGS